MTNDLNGTTRSYEGKRDEVVFEELVLPEDAPQWAVDRYLGEDVIDAAGRLWNDIEAKENSHRKRDISQLAKSFTISLPHELSREQQVALIQGYVRDNLVSEGQVADVVIHDKGDGNPHAHVMTTMRTLGPDGHDKRVGNYIAARMELMNQRCAWAVAANTALELAGFDRRIDHRSNLDRGIALEPCNYSKDIAENIEADGGVYRAKTRALEARAANEALLMKDPGQVLLVLGQEKAMFIEDDIAFELRRKLPANVGKGQIEGIVRAAMASPELVATGEVDYRGEPIFTTRAVLEMGRQLTRDTLQMRDSELDFSSVGGGDISLDPRLSDEQRAAVDTMISPQRISVVSGYAGAGKTTAVIEASRVWEARGFTVIGAAVSGKAVQALTGLQGQLGTIAQIEAQWDLGAVPPPGKFVVFMDEASMVGTATWSRFEARINAMGGKLNVLGAPEQLGPVNDSSALQHVSSLVGATYMTQVRRQRDLDDQAAIQEISRSMDGVEPALMHFEQKGAITLEADLESAIEALPQRFFEGVTPDNFWTEGFERIALFHTNASVDAANAALRVHAVEAGFVKQDGGLVLPSELEINAGDRVRFTRPFADASVSRNAFASVVAVSGHNLTLAVDGRAGAFTLDAQAFPHFDYGYAATIHKSQGMSVKGKVFAVVTRMFDWHLLDVAISRHVEDLDITIPVSDFGEDLTVETRDDVLASVVKSTSRSSLQQVMMADVAPTLRRAHPTLEDITTIPRADRTAGITAPAEDMAAERVALSGDVHLFQQSQRLSGLLRSAFKADSPMFGDDPRGYSVDPLKVVDDLLAERGMLRASDVAGRLAEVVFEPATFTRLYYEAMGHPDLVILSETGTGREGRVYSSVDRIDQAVSLMDQGMRMAVSGAPFSVGLQDAQVSVSDHPEQLLAPARADVQDLPDVDTKDVQQQLLSARISQVADECDLTSDKRRALEAVFWPARIGIIEEISTANTAGVIAAARDVIPTGKVVALHTSKKTAQKFAVAAGIRGLDLYALSSGLDNKTITFGPQDILVVPEATGLHIDQLELLISQVERTGAKILLHNDPSLEAGGDAVRHLAARLPSVKLGEFDAIAPNRRGLLSQGAPFVAAVDDLYSLGHINGAVNETQHVRAFVEDYMADPAEGKLGVAGSRRMRDMLNREIAAMHSAQVGVEGGDEHSLSRGRYATPLSLSVGTRLVATRDMPDHAILSGQIADVSRFSPSGAVVVRIDGREVEIASGADASALEYGYVVTARQALSDRMQTPSAHIFANKSLSRNALISALQLGDDITLSLPIDVSNPVSVEAFFTRLNTRAPQGSILDHGFDPTRALQAAGDSYTSPSLDVRPDIAPHDQEILDQTRAAYRASPALIVADLARQSARFNVDDLASDLGPYYPEKDKSELLAQSRDLIARLQSDGTIVKAGHFDYDGTQCYTTRVQAEVEQGGLQRGLALAARSLHDVSGPEGATQLGQHVTGPERLSLAVLPADHDQANQCRKEIGAVWRARGYQIISTGLSQGWAARAAAALGPDTQAFSLAALEASWARGAVPADGKFVVVLDQAEMANSTQWARIQARIDDLGGKLIALSKPQALPRNRSVCLFQALSSEVGVHQDLPTPVQSKEAERRATVALSGNTQDAARAIAIHYGLGNIHFAGQMDGATGAIARRFWADADQSDHRRVALAHSTKAAEALNGAIRTEGRRLGHLGEPVRLNGEEANIGQRVYVSASRNGLEEGQHVKLLAIDADGSVQVQTEDGSDVIRLDQSDTNVLNPSFAATLWQASQRLPTDKTFLLASRSMDQSLYRVGMSCHRHGFEMHVPETAIKDVEALKLAAGRRNDLDILTQPVPPPPMEEITVPGISNRADRVAPLLKAGLFAQDAHLQSIAQRRADLLSISCKFGDPVLGEDPKGYALHPRRAVDDLIGEASVIRAEDVAAKLAHTVRDPQTFVHMFAEAMAHPDLVVLSETGIRGEGRVYSTLDHIKRETELSDRISAMALVPTGFNPADRVLRAATQTAHGPMSPDQERGLRHATSGLRVAMLTGYAGSGKTTVLNGVRSVYEAAGWSVTGTTLSGDAARNLQSESGIASRSVTSLLMAAQHDRIALRPRSLLVVDEAAMLNATHYDALIGLCERSGASLLLVGDGQQIQAHGPGAMFRSFADRIGTVTLSKVWRQKDPLDARASEGLAAGGAQAKRAIDHYSAQGYVVGTGSDVDPEHHLATVVAGYRADPSQDKTMLTFRNVDVATLNALARTAEQQNRDVSHEEALAVDREGGSLAVQAGDLIRITKPDWEHGLIKGDRGEVTLVNPQAQNYTLQIGTGEEARHITLPLADGPALTYDYAQTIDSAQGMSVQSVHVAATANLTQNRTYVAATRFTERLRLYAPTSQDEAANFLKRIATREGHKVTTLEREYGYDPHRAGEAVQHAKADQADLAKYLESHGVTSVAPAASKYSLAQLFKSNPAHEDLAAAAATRALSHVLDARVIDGEAVMDGALQSDVSRLLNRVSSRDQWKEMTARLPRAARTTPDDMARRWSDAKPGETLLPEARALARAITVAEAENRQDVGRALKAGLEVLSNRVTEARDAGRFDDMLKDAFAPLAQGRDLVPEGAAIGEQTNTPARAASYPRMGNNSRRISFFGAIKDIYTTEYDKARERVERSISSDQPAAHKEGTRKMDEDMILGLLSAMNRYVPFEHEFHDLDAPRELLGKLYIGSREATPNADQQNKIDALAQRMAHERALTQLRISLAYEIKPDARDFEWRDCIFYKKAPFALFNPAAAQEYRDQFAKRAKQVGAIPSVTDKAIARMSVLAMSGSEDMRRLGEGLSFVGNYEEVAPEHAVEARNARQTVISRILASEDDLELSEPEAQEALSDLYKGYSLKEITALARPEEKMPEGVPALSADDQRRLAKRILAFAKVQTPKDAPQHSTFLSRDIQNGPRLGLHRDRNLDGPHLDGPGRR